MNNTLSNPSISNWKHVKAQYIAAAAGAALAVSAMVIAGTWQGNGNPTPASKSTGYILLARNAEPQQHFFVVGSEADGEALISANNELGQVPGRGVVSVVVAGSPAADALLGEGVRELMHAGTDYTVIDTTVARIRPQTSAADANLDAAIIAGVVSSERAAYVFDAASVATRQASDADLMASVISTERAAWVFGEAPGAASSSDTAPYANEAIENYAGREAAQIGLTTR